jgi:hypothetical protein
MDELEVEFFSKYSDAKRDWQNWIVDRIESYCSAVVIPSALTSTLAKAIVDIDKLASSVKFSYPDKKFAKSICCAILRFNSQPTSNSSSAVSAMENILSQLIRYEHTGLQEDDHRLVNVLKRLVTATLMCTKAEADGNADDIFSIIKQASSDLNSLWTQSD